jgi:hypothetical protein
MLSGFKVFHHRSNPGPVPAVQDEPQAVHDTTGHGNQHPPHVWSKQHLDERRSRKRDECLRGLVELEAELRHEVEPDR